MSVTTRTATIADVQSMTSLHMASFRPGEHLGALLGPAFVRAYYMWHVTDDCAYAMVAELDGSLVGLLGMCDGPFTMRMLRGCRRAFAFAILRRPWLLVDRRMWSRVARAKASSRWVGEFCSTPGVAQMTIGAVDASARGHSVFPSLIKCCEEVSVARGIAAVRAGVYRGNTSCKRAFVKSNWAEVPELGSDETVFFVRVFSPELLKRFPQLSPADSSGPPT